MSEHQVEHPEEIPASIDLAKDLNDILRKIKDGEFTDEALTAIAGYTTMFTNHLITSSRNLTKREKLDQVNKKQVDDATEFIYPGKTQRINRILHDFGVAIIGGSISLIITGIVVNLGFTSIQVLLLFTLALIGFFLMRK